MTERKPQIAFAPVTPSGFIIVNYTKDQEHLVRDKLGGAWQSLESKDWRIRKVRIEIEETSGE